MTYDFALTGGRIIDPAQGRDEIADIAFKDGRVAAIGAGLAAAETRDVSGLIVTPGLIDLHTHVYWGGTSLGIDADAYMRESAVTTAIDTGSAGPGNFAGFAEHVIAKSEARILAYLHVSHAGIFGFSNRVMVGESHDLRLMDPVTTVEVASAHPDLIVGIKVRLGRHASGIHGMTPFEYAIQSAEAAGLPMMVHIDEPPPSYAAVVDRLRPGDVLTHCFRPFPNTPIAPNGEILPQVLAARARGVHFDIGHGMGSFAFETARRALGAGFKPDVISSDVHALCRHGPAFDQLTTMTKFLALGLDLGEVVEMSTAAPARALSRPDLGDLSLGSAGDASILRLDETPSELVDVPGERITFAPRLRAAGVVRAGKWIDPA